MCFKFITIFKYKINNILLLKTLKVIRLMNTFYSKWTLNQIISIVLYIV